MTQRLFIVFLLLLLLALPVRAEEPELEIDPEAGLGEEIRGSLGSFDAEQPKLFGESLLELLTEALKNLSGSFRGGLLSSGIMLAAVLLCSLLSELSERQEAVRFAAVLAIVGAGTGSVQSMITLAGETLNQMREYSLLLLPGLSSLAVFSGGAGTGAAVYTGGVLFFDLLLRISSALVLPVCWLYTGAGAADAALGDGRLSALEDFLRWAAAGVLKWTSYLFTGYLALSGVLCGTMDSVKLRTTRAALSGMVPVVGGIISDASDAILSAAAALKSAAGVYGMLAVLAICMAPFLRLGVQLLLLKGTAAVSGLFGQPVLTGLIGRLADVMGLLLALTGAFCTAALLCVVLLMKANGIS